MLSAIIGTIAVTGALIALVSLLIYLLESTFHRLGARSFAVLRCAFGVTIAVAGGLAWLSSPSVTTTTCEVVESSVDAGGVVADDQPVRIRLRWRVGATTYTNPRPFEVRQKSARSGNELALHKGATIPCFYRGQRPARIYAGSYRSDMLMPRTVALGLVLGGLFLLAVGIRRWRRGRAGAPVPSWQRGTSGGIGLVLITLAVAGLFVATELGNQWLGYGLATLAGLGFLLLIVREIRAQDRVFRDIEERLELSEYWPRSEDVPARRRSDTEDGIDPWEDQRVKGLWRGVPVRVAMTAAGAIAQIELPDWPTDLVIEDCGADSASGHDERVTTGDSGFDEVLHIAAPEATWRPRLGHEVRSVLVDCMSAARARIDAPHQILEFSVDAAEVDRLDTYLDRGVRLAQVLAQHPAAADNRAWLFDTLEHEPEAQVRLGHYQWLYSKGWQVPRLLRAAAADRAPAVRDWAAEHLPPSDGAFR